MMNKYTPILADLGLMHTIQKMKSTRFKAGTPFYLGEKLTLGKVRFYREDCKLDIYALGATIYEILNWKNTSRFLT